MEISTFGHRKLQKFHHLTSLLWQKFRESYVKTKELMSSRKYCLVIENFPHFSLWKLQNYTITIFWLKFREFNVHHIIIDFTQKKLSPFNSISEIIFMLVQCLTSSQPNLREIFRFTFLCKQWVKLSKTNFQWKLRMSIVLFKVFKSLSSIQAEKNNAK